MAIEMGTFWSSMAQGIGAADDAPDKEVYRYCSLNLCHSQDVRGRDAVSFEVIRSQGERWEVISANRQKGRWQAAYCL